MKNTALAFLAASVLLVGAGKQQTYTGVITDTMCGLNHAHMNVKPDSKCVRDCVRSGQYKYALHDGKKMYILSDQKLPEPFAAQKVKVTGVLYEKTGILKVDSIVPVN